jgi:hypothetical protein
MTLDAIIIAGTALGLAAGSRILAGRQYRHWYRTATRPGKR